LRERRFLFAYLLTGNATQSYLATVLQIGSQPEHAHQAASRKLRWIRQRIDWPALLERIDIGALNMIRSLEAELQAHNSVAGDSAAALLAELLHARGQGFKANLTKGDDFNMKQADLDSKSDRFETLQGDS